MREFLGSLSLCIPDIMSGAVHWSEKTPAQQLGEWLNGSTPPPRCTAHALEPPYRQCLKHALREGGLCVSMHKCMSRQGGCESLRLPGAAFCAYHTCKSPMANGGACNLERLTEGEYCSRHSCPCCINDAQRTQPIGHSQPFACPMHTCAGSFALSDKASSLCRNQSLYPHGYCIEHCCVACAELGLILNLPQAGRSRYCALHKCEMDFCNHHRLGMSRYCEDHICRLCVLGSHASGMWNSVDPDFLEAGLCADHRCNERDCFNARLGVLADTPPRPLLEMPQYCYLHTCRVCLLQGLPCTYQVEEEYPRNVCMDHTLCSHITLNGQCVCLAEPFMAKCAKHENDDGYSDVGIIAGDGQCCGIAGKTKKRCKTTGTTITGGQFWCLPHQAQAPPPPVTVKPVRDDDDLVVDGYEDAVDRLWRELPPPEILDEYRHNG